MHWSRTINHICCSYLHHSSFRNFIIMKTDLWLRPLTQNSDWPFKAYDWRGRYIAVIAITKQNYGAISTCVTAMFIASIGKMISATPVRRGLHMNALYARVPEFVYNYPSNPTGHVMSATTGLCLICVTLCSQKIRHLPSKQKTRA